MCIIAAILMHYTVFSEFGVALTELTLEHDGLLQIRQMTALLLKQYVDTHWSSLSDKFKGIHHSVQISQKRTEKLLKLILCIFRFR